MLTFIFLNFLKRNRKAFVTIEEVRSSKIIMTRQILCDNFFTKIIKYN